MDKYNKPNLPSPHCVVEDLSAASFEELKAHLTFAASEELLQDAYNCYLKSKQLNNDLVKQNDLNSQLEQLNRQLLGNVESMRKQSMDL